jgi:hypothetical protein
VLVAHSGRVRVKADAPATGPSAPATRGPRDE